MLFHLFKILIFWVVRRGGLWVVKAKNGPKWLSHSVSQELYLIWLWFLVHMCKIMIYPELFSICQNSDFSSFSKFINKCKKEILSCVPPSSYVCDFSFFQNLLHMCVIFQAVKGVKGQKKLFNYFLSWIIMIFGTRVTWWHLQVLFFIFSKF